ncbi:MAG: 2-amino-4-hydroxy-6-hydroxymethyldihydropteridine diphosphokinase [Ignavibacteria bacterium]|nr:2-amino-4-hydroxy-6-hydroxymethyldihydropteridine diphosphokinase [Ignavibacteria bacterium]
MTMVLLSLGSNIEPRGQTLRDAVEIIRTSILTESVTSSMYETAPVGFLEQASFLNLCIRGATNLSAMQLHVACKELEVQLGRVQRMQWHEREIDVDIILFGDLILESSELQIPHPRFRERRFVLVPAAEIAPDAVDPLSHLTLYQLVDNCKDHSSVAVVDWSIA